MNTGPFVLNLEEIKKRLEMRPSEDIVQKRSDDVAAYRAQVITESVLRNERKKLMVDLLDGYNEDTKYCVIPAGTVTWRILLGTFLNGDVAKEIHDVALIDFFGVYMGYCKFTNTIYVWSSR